jgi:dTDP-4-amino-4,6-dideoxygalactose transaminase
LQNGAAPLAVKKMIPVARPMVGEEEVAAVREVIDSRWLTQGKKVASFEQVFAEYVGAEHAVAVSSCTTGLQLALMAVGVAPGDIVVTVSHSFIASANAIRHCGAEPFFIDVEAEGFNIDPTALGDFFASECERRADGLYLREAMRFKNSRSSPLRFVDQRYLGRVRAVLAVHQMGFPCRIAEVSELCRAQGVELVEDAACAIGSEVRLPNSSGVRKIGDPFGKIAVFSLHARKLVTTGEGGVLTTNDAQIAESLRLLRQHGMAVSDLVRHGSSRHIVETYTMTGFNYRLSDIQAAVGLAQMTRLEAMLDDRRRVDQLFRQHLSHLDWVILAKEPENSRCNWQSYPVTLAPGSPYARDELIQLLLDQGIASRPGIMNAHQEEPYREFGYCLPHSERARSNVVLFPIYSELSAEDVVRIASALTARPGTS